MRLFGPIYLLIILLTFSTAQASSPLYFTDINVDVTADNAAKARDIAMTQANRQALMSISANFTNKEGLEVLNRLTDEQLLNFIKETTVLEEKTSNVRYMAKLRISANDEILRQYLQEKNVPLVISSAAHILIIPIYRETANSPALLWEKENIWRTIWEQNPPTIGSIQFSTLKQTDAMLLNNAQEALSLNPYIYKQLLASNNGNDVYIVEAYFTNETTLTISIITPQTGKRQIFSVSGPHNNELFKQASVETALRLSDQQKGRSVVTSNTIDSITVLYKYNNLASWLKNEKKISAVTAVRDIEINAIGNGRIQFKIHFIGDFNILQNALQAKNLQLTRTGTYYTLSDI